MDRLASVIRQSVREMCDAKPLAFRLVFRERADGSVEVVKSATPSELTLREIAEIEGCSVRTVKRRYVETRILNVREGGRVDRQEYARIAQNKRR